MAELNVYIDGASRGNPGPAGAGICITDQDSVFQRGISHYLGDKLTNNQAEYGALILLLRDAAAGQHIFRNADIITILSDSQLLVKQMTGKFRVKSQNIVKYHNAARKLIEQLNFPVKFRIIPREENKIADKLAKLAVDFRAAGTDR